MKKQPKKRRILIATVTVGAGHVQAAKALEEAWKQRYPNDEVHCKDILEFTGGLHQKTYRDGYVELVKHAPEIFGRFFTQTDNASLIQKLNKPRRFFAHISTPKFLAYVNEFQPDVVLCTHFLPIEALGAVINTKKLTHKPLIACVVTDFEAHALWLEPCIDITFVATEHTKARLVARGVSAETIFVTGIPVSPNFSKSYQQTAIREKLHIKKNLPTLLVLGGGFGVGPIVEVMESINKIKELLQTLVVAGRNEQLKKKLENATYRHPTTIFGFVTNIYELMMASNLILTKPGGLTSSEAMALGKPLLIFNPIPGQEMANSDFLLEHGAASKLNHIDDLPYKVSLLMKPARLLSLSRQAKKLGRPKAAFDICDVVSKNLR